MTDAFLAGNDLVIESRIIPEREVPVRIYRPAFGPPKSVMVFAHGGGFSWGTLDDYDQISRNLAAGTGSTLVSVDYRLAPEHVFPAGFDDVYQATLWTVANLGQLGGEGCKVIIAGDSAGACLAAGVAQRGAFEKTVRLDAQLLLYPMIEYYDRTPADFFSLSDRFHPSFEAIKGAWDKYLPNAPAALPPYAVPTRRADFMGLPPAFLAVAENDPLRFEGLLYGEQMEASGIAIRSKKYDGVAHGFLGEEPGSPQVEAAISDISAWLAQL